MSTKPTPKAVTKQYDFLSATTGGDCLFSVRGGIPLDDAFDQLSLLLAQGRSVAEFMCIAGSTEDDPEAPGAAVRLLDFSHALVQAMHHGLTEYENAQPKP